MLTLSYHGKMTLGKFYVKFVMDKHGKNDLKPHDVQNLKGHGPNSLWIWEKGGGTERESNWKTNKVIYFQSISVALM